MTVRIDFEVAFLTRDCLRDGARTRVLPGSRQSAPWLCVTQMRRGETMPRAQKALVQSASARPPSSSQPHCTAAPPGGGAAVGGPSSADPTASPTISSRLCPGRHA